MSSVPNVTDASLLDEAVPDTLKLPTLNQKSKCTTFRSKSPEAAQIVNYFIITAAKQPIPYPDSQRIQYGNTSFYREVKTSLSYAIL